MANDYIRQKSAGIVTIYTDASKQNLESSYAIHCPSHNHQEKFKLKNYASICTAELLAIEHGLKYAKQFPHQTAIIFSDSLSSCTTIDIQAQEPYVTEILGNVLKLLSETRACIAWIPSHVGIAGNEKADELAKEALDDGKIQQNKIRQVDARTLIKAELREEHQIYFESSEKGDKFKRICPQIPNMPWYHGTTLESADIRLINRLISNHSYDRRWLFRFGKEETENCDECLIPETAEHKIFHCFKHTNIRGTYPILKTLTGSEMLMKHDRRDEAIDEILQLVSTLKIEI